MMLNDTLNIASAGLAAQEERLRVVAENIANADTTGRTPGEQPYRRKLLVFGNVLNDELGINTVQVTKRTHDMSDFVKKYDPTHPAADAQGYVMHPNVEPVLEMVDLREARRGYEANLAVVQVTREMESRALSIIS